MQIVEREPCKRHFLSNGVSQKCGGFGNCMDEEEEKTIILSLSAFRGHTLLGNQALAPDKGTLVLYPTSIALPSSQKQRSYI